VSDAASEHATDLELAVVVPTRGRPLRVRWLLNELEEQSLAPQRFEVVVVHPAGDSAERVVARHPMGRAGRARSVAVPAGLGRAAARNAGWRATPAPLVAFTHDDCRPAAGWLEDLIRLGGEAPGAVLQGAVEADPEQGALLHARFKRTHRSRPPDPLAPACNVAFPRAGLDGLGGFDEGAEAVDGAELAARAARAGRDLRAADEVVVYHAVRPVGPAAWARALATGAVGLPAAIRRAPGLRDALVLGVAVRTTHLLLPAALAGAVAARRWPSAALLAAPWLGLLLVEQRGRRVGPVRALARLPLRAARDMAEFGLLAAGSARARTLCL
jgi:GT2 family glycosyltransferase